VDIDQIQGSVFLLDFGGGVSRFDHDLVHNPCDARQFSNSVLGGLSLKLPGHFAGERDPTIFYGNFDGLWRNGGLPFEHVKGASRDLIVRCCTGRTNFDFLEALETVFWGR